MQLEQENDVSESSELNSESSDLKIQLDQLRNENDKRDNQLKDCYDMIENLKLESEKLDDIWQKKLTSSEKELNHTKNNADGQLKEKEENLHKLTLQIKEFESIVTDKTEELSKLEKNLIEKDAVINNKNKEVEDLLKERENMLVDLKELENKIA